MEALGVERIEAVADRGYFKIEDIEACEAAGVTAYVPKPIRGSAVREGFFSKEVFRYELDQDVFICPAGAVLSPRYRGKSRDNVKVDYANRDACTACAMKPRCTRSFRRVSRLENEAVLDRRASAAGAAPRNARPTAKQRRASLWHHQAMDGPRRVPDAPARVRTGRVQPDGARLQHQTGHHPGRGAGPGRRSKGAEPVFSRLNEALGVG